MTDGIMTETEAEELSEQQQAPPPAGAHDAEAGADVARAYANMVAEMGSATMVNTSRIQELARAHLALIAERQTLRNAGVNLLDRAEAAEAERDVLRVALVNLQKRAKECRKSRDLVGPTEYQDDWPKMKVWQKALYSVGKEFDQAIRAALAAVPAPACDCYMSPHTDWCKAAPAQPADAGWRPYSDVDGRIVDDDSGRPLGSPGEEYMNDH